MRNKLFETSAVVVGIAIVVVIYFSRYDGTAEQPLPDTAPEAAILEERASQPTPRVEQQVVDVPATVAVETPEAVTQVDTAEVETARAAWQTAIADLGAVEAELDVLDTRFDAKEAELAEMEAQGMDPDALEEEMMIFLDGIVDEYDVLETRLAEAEAEEARAAERLAELQAQTPQP